MPQKLNVGHAGVGSITFLRPLLLNLLGARYQANDGTGAGSATPATNALLGGQGDYMTTEFDQIIQHVPAGPLESYALVSN